MFFKISKDFIDLVNSEVFLFNKNFFSEIKKYFQNEKIEYLNFFLDFEKSEKSLSLYKFFQKEGTVKNIIFASLKQENIESENNENFRDLIGKIVKILQSEKINKIGFVIKKDFRFFDLFKNIEICSKILSTTLLLANYSFEDYITDSKRHLSKIEEFFLISDVTENFLEIEKGLNEGLTIGNCSNQSRRWSDLTPGELYPKTFSEDAFNFLKDEKNLKIKIFEKRELEDLGMGGIIGVCKGSVHEPRMVVVEYTPENYEKTICLVGKGVTFDTGGISIKPSDNMEDMKSDMTGAAVVLSSMKALASLNSPFRIIACAPMVENMPGGKALKPGDIIKFYNGKTAEIKNTDAEGRLILADALSYVSKEYRPDFIIDFATLTGAACIALGPFYAAIISYFENFSNQICKAGDVTGNNCWRLPINKKYQEAVVSDVADLCNISKKYCRAGTITAGAFLHNFVPKEITYAHIDIASVSTHSVGKSYINSIGATGFGVDLIIELIKDKKYLS